MLNDDLQDVLKGIQYVLEGGTYLSEQLSKEEADGYPRLEKAREDNRRTPIEETYRRLSDAER